MSLKHSLQVAAVASGSLLCGACGMGEITSPAGPDSDGDGIPDNIDALPNGPDGAAQAFGQVSFACTENMRGGSDLRSLSRSEYKNALTALLRASTSDATSKSVMDSVAGAFDEYPQPTVSKAKPFAVMDQDMSDERVQSLVKIGTAVGKAVSSSPQRISELVGACATQKAANDGAMSTCIDGFIARFGKRVLRHTLSDAEKKFYRDVYAAGGTSVDASGIADVVAVMLNAPQFAYRVELGGKQDAKNAQLYQLSDSEIATRLAFEFWQSPPDDDLLAAADRGELSGNGYTAVLDEVLSDPRASDAIERFVREWLALDGAMKPLEALVGSPVFDAFAGDDSPTPQLKEEMIQDVTDSMAYSYQHGESLAEWLQSPYSFAKSQDLAAIYQAPVWDGKSEPPRFPANQRAGLITRAALLSTGTSATRPIMKGVMIRERLLCDAMLPPPANVGKLPEVSGEKTTRELVQGLTETAGSNCAGCHVTQINPLGFATEGFDALGRVRKEQPLFDDKGKVVRKKPVDTSSIPRVWGNDSTPSSGAHDLATLITKSGKAEACFAREWVRYAAARPEKVEVDGCALETIRATLSKGGSLKDALRSYALLPQFRQRYVPAN